MVDMPTGRSSTWNRTAAK